MSGETTETVKDTNFSTGAVRSAERNHLDFTGLPLVGLIGAARTAAEGATKYGRYNYMKGMPVHDIINHVIGHYVMYLLGDRSEPHLDHATWGAMEASQSATLDPELSAPHLLGPGATLTEANLAFLDDNAPALAEKRRAGAFSGIGGWDLRSLPEIARLLGQRDQVASNKSFAALLDAEVVGGTQIRSLAEAIERGLAAPVVEEAKPKKKRRTKAEMEAARAAAAGEVATGGGGAVETPEEKAIAEEFAADAPTDDELVASL